jgi:transposase
MTDDCVRFGYGFDRANTSIWRKQPLTHYVGLDVSLKETKLHVLDEAGNRIWRSRCATEPGAIAAAVRRYAPSALRSGLESGPLTTWLWTALRAEGLPIDVSMVVTPRRRSNKTDTNDAEGLAHLVRAGWYRGVRVKSRAGINRRDITLATP